MSRCVTFGNYCSPARKLWSWLLDRWYGFHMLVNKSSLSLPVLSLHGLKLRCYSFASVLFLLCFVFWLFMAYWWSLKYFSFVSFLLAFMLVCLLYFVAIAAFDVCLLACVFSWFVSYIICYLFYYHYYLFSFQTWGVQSVGHYLLLVRLEFLVSERIKLIAVVPLNIWGWYPQVWVSVFNCIPFCFLLYPILFPVNGGQL